MFSGLNASPLVVFPVLPEWITAIPDSTWLCSAAVAVQAKPTKRMDTTARPIIGTSVSRDRSEEHTSELQSHRYLLSFPTRRSSDLDSTWLCSAAVAVQAKPTKRMDTTARPIIGTSVSRD